MESYLKNGDVVRGTVIEKTPEFLILEDDKTVWFIKESAVKWLRVL